MISSRLPLTLAVADNPFTHAILSGRIPIEGVDARFITVKPLVAAYRRMVRDLAFDVCEVAATTYMVARSLGTPLVALPVFLSRSFHHGGLVVRPDAGIRTAKDLEGKKVGVRAYSVTTGVWTRGILSDEYGLDTSKVTWVVDDEEHVAALKLPPNVERVPPGSSLVELMAKGEISAGFAGTAGLGRVGTPSEGWNARIPSLPACPELLPNANELELAWHRRTGIYPMHGALVVKEDVLKAHPWVARSLYDAFARAKAEWLEELASGHATSEIDNKYRRLAGIVGPDPLPFGMAANQASIAALTDYAFQQKLTPRRMEGSELFIDPHAT